MTTKELARLVYNMRQAQDAYWKSPRKPGSLNEAKRLERELDKAVKEILWGQPKLFETEESNGR